MLCLRIALGLYFTGALGIAGIAKLEYPEQFAAALRRHDLLPQWSTTGFSRLFPCGEILLACLLALGVTPLIIATVVVVVFLVFLAARAKVLITKGGGACGCFGDTVTNQTDGANVATSTGYAAFAGLHYYVVATTAEPARWVGVLTLAFFLALFTLLGWRTRRRRTFFCTRLSPERSPMVSARQTQERRDVRASAAVHTPSKLPN